jgi:hypothetical protein
MQQSAMRKENYSGGAKRITKKILKLIECDIFNNRVHASLSSHDLCDMLPQLKIVFLLPLTDAIPFLIKASYSNAICAYLGLLREFITSVPLHSYANIFAHMYEKLVFICTYEIFHKLINVHVFYTLHLF